MGERVTIYEFDDEGWAWGQLAADGYVGWLAGERFARAARSAPTHRVTRAAHARVSRTVDQAAAGRDAAARQPHRGAREQDRFAVSALGFLPAAHLAPTRDARDRFRRGRRALPRHAVSVGRQDQLRARLLRAGAGRAECLRHPLPARQRHAGKRAWRVGRSRQSLRRGDLVFWKGHVAIVRDAATLVHANAFHMAVAIEPLAEAIARIGAGGNHVTSVRRPS